MVPFWVPIIIRHLYLGYPKRDPNFDNHPYIAKTSDQRLLVAAFLIGETAAVEVCRAVLRRLVDLAWRIMGLSKYGFKYHKRGYK